MRIAVIGWGSLIWCPGCLQIKTRWRSDGPALPIEFARISRDGRLTLVIHPDSLEVGTYWAVSELETLKEARQNLRLREAADLKDIHSLTLHGRGERAIPKQVLAKIRAWLRNQDNVQAAIWTGLPSNWERERQGRKFSVEGAVQYISELERARDEAKAAYDRAREYVSNAPSQIQTSVRKIIQQKKGWKDATLPTILFE